MSASAIFASGQGGANGCSTTGNLGVNAWAQYNGANNQMSATSQNANQGGNYDLDGNVTYDGANNYHYDGEGRLCAVQTGGNGGSVTGYLYNAEGTRVVKGSMSSMACPNSSSSFSTVSAQYLLDPGGDQVTELTGSGSWVHSNVWAGAHLDATYDTKGLHFHLFDPLGTRRVQVAAISSPGAMEEYCLSLPFGDALNCIYAPSAPSTADDATEHHFTGKERDTESGNDYFGARYYASTMGRFMSPDWSAKIEPVPYAKLDNPQSLNLYAYVGNNPLIHIDVDGHCADHYDNGTCKVNVDPSTGAAGAKAGKQLEGVLNKYDKAINGLGDKSKFDIKDSKGNVIGSMTGKEIKAVWNGTSFTVTDRSFNNGGAGGATGGTWHGDGSFTGLSQLNPGSVAQYANAGSARNEGSFVGVSTLTFHELAHETHFGQTFNYMYEPSKLTSERESNVSTAGSRMAGTVGAPYDCSISGGCQ